MFGNQIPVTHGDTDIQPGYDCHKAKVTTVDGKVSTVATGRLQMNPTAG